MKSLVPTIATLTSLFLLAYSNSASALYVGLSTATDTNKGTTTTYPFEGDKVKRLTDTRSTSLVIGYQPRESLRTQLSVTHLEILYGTGDTDQGFGIDADWLYGYQLSRFTLYAAPGIGLYRLETAGSNRVEDIDLVRQGILTNEDTADNQYKNSPHWVPALRMALGSKYRFSRDLELDLAIRWQRTTDGFMWPTEHSFYALNLGLFFKL